jgi:hypothetical protein
MFVIKTFRQLHYLNLNWAIDWMGGRGCVLHPLFQRVKPCHQDQHSYY